MSREERRAYKQGKKDMLIDILGVILIELVFVGCFIIWFIG